MAIMNKYQTIAEIGINHHGDSEIARKLILESSKAGATMVKFQYRNLQRSYSDQAGSEQIGDEIIKKEIKKNYLSPSQIIELSDFAKSINIKPGISFFILEDMDDFNYDFEFYKIPSVEFQNFELIESCFKSNKPVYLSTGCTTEDEILTFCDKYQDVPNWTLMHCISNYPVSARNAKLGYINKLRDISKRKVGYSSHDENWEMCLIAATNGALVIERHITLDVTDKGLDHSSSSSPKDFKRMIKIINNLDIALEGNNFKREPNQGELLNKQNLGRSLYAKDDFFKGQPITIDDFMLLSPNVGITPQKLKTINSNILTNDLAKGSPLLESSLVDNSIAFKESDVDMANKYIISLPVRLHDYTPINNKFGLNCYEFHLSFGEVLNQQLAAKNYHPTKKYSIHLPDYISSTHLIDPFSENEDIANQSITILDKVANFASDLQQHTSSEVPIVGSFSVSHLPKEDFYQRCSALVDSFKTKSCSLYPQWLPPIAWYFGGSVDLTLFNSDEDIFHLEKQNLRICFDVCHFLMCLRAGTVGDSSFNRLLNLSGHLHIADSLGIDGEGIQIGKGDKENLKYLLAALKQPNLIKVLEVWQGHLENYKGFHEAVESSLRLLSNP